MSSLEGGARGRAAVPSGASTGEREALELRDGDRDALSRQRRDAKRSRTSTARLPTRCSSRELSQRELDDAMIRLDGTPNKGRLGANALLGVSMAALKADAVRAASSLYAHIAHLAGNTAGYLLPVPMMNILNGGAHADSNVDFQEFMVMPVGAPTLQRRPAHRRRDLPRAARHSQEARALDRRRRRRRLRAEPAIESRSARSGARGGRQGRLSRRARDVYLALDVASSEFWAGGGALRVQEVRRAGARLRRDGRALRRVVPRVSDHLDRRRLRRRRLARLGRC